MRPRHTCALLVMLAICAAVPPPATAQTQVRTSETTVEKDFTTPWAAVETMIRAAKAEDVETLRQCFDRRTEREFVPYRDGTATDRQLDALAEWAWDAYVTEVEMDGIRDAVVHVKFPPENRPFAMKLVRTSVGWKIGAR